MAAASTRPHSSAGSPPPGGAAVAVAPGVVRRGILLAGAGLVVAALAAYANSFGGPFIFDDFLSIPDNPTLRSWLTAFTPPGGGVTVTGRPLLNLSFALNHALSGDQVWSYHLLNLLIHALAGLTLFGLVRRTLAGLGEKATAAAPSPARWSAAAATGVAFAVALLWTVHPLQTESVTYIVQRAESLMGLFYLLTLYAFVRGAEPGGRAAWFGLAFVSCLLGMATKEVMVSAPLIVLLYDRTFLAGSFGAAWRSRGRVHLALASTWLLLAGLVWHAAARGGSAGFGAGLSFWAYAATQFQAVAHYLWLAVWPQPLILDYGAQTVASFGEVVPYVVVVAPLVVTTLVALVRWPAFGFLGFWFFGVLAPTSLVPVVRQTLAEHRLYLALAPVLVLLVLALRAALGRRFWFGLAAVGAVFGGLTLARNHDYRSSAAIWSDTVAKRPGNAAARNNYGNLLAQDGQTAEALRQYAEAIRLEPSFPDPHYNAGKVLQQLGRLPEAVAHYEQALQVRSDLPDVHTALGTALEGVGRSDEAVAHYAQALRLDSSYASAHSHLGDMLARAGRPAEAIAHYEQALQLAPQQPEVHNNLGNALRAEGRMSAALAHYEEALRLDPDFAAAHSNLARAAAAAGDLPAAVAHLQQALKTAPRDPELHNDFGMVLVMAGRVADGIEQFEAALRLNPNLPQVHLNLAITLENTGRLSEAAAHYAAARRLTGDAAPPPH